MSGRAIDRRLVAVQLHAALRGAEAERLRLQREGDGIGAHAFALGFLEGAVARAIADLEYGAPERFAERARRADELHAEMQELRGLLGSAS